MNSSRVTVVIPAFNSQSTIARAVRSAVNQTRPAREVIVVDNGSTDGTGDVLRRLEDECGGVVRVVDEPQRGAARARNAGVKAAKTEWVAFLDADDEWLPTKLAAVEGHLTEENVIVGHSVENERGDGLLTVVECRRGSERHSDAFVGLMFGNFLATSAVTIRRNTVLWHGGFDGNLVTAEDYDLWLKVAESKEGMIIVLSGVFAVRHLSAGSLSSRYGTRGAAWKVRARYLGKLLCRRGFWAPKGWGRLWGRAMMKGLDLAGAIVR